MGCQSNEFNRVRGFFENPRTRRDAATDAVEQLTAELFRTR